MMIIKKLEKIASRCNLETGSEAQGTHMLYSLPVSFPRKHDSDKILP